MESDRRQGSGSKLNGRVLRVSRGEAELKSPSQTFILVLDDDPMGDDEVLGWVSESAVLLGSCAFELDVPWSEALLYFELVQTAHGRSRNFEFESRPDVPSRVVEVDLSDIVSQEEFHRLLEVAQSSLRDRDPNGVAESVAAQLPPSKIPALWATIALMTDALAAAKPPYPPGSDSFLYWATALVWGPRTRYLAARDGNPVPVDDGEEGFAELLLDVPRRALSISSGENVSFVRAATDHHKNQPVEGVEPGSQLLGIYFVADIPTGTCECVGLVSTHEWGRAEAVARSFADRSVARLGGTLRRAPIWFEQGTASMFSGMEVISLAEPDQN